MDYANRQKIIVEGAVITSGTITTVGSLSNIVANGGVDPRYQFMDAARLAYADGIRNNLSFT